MVAPRKFKKVFCTILEVPVADDSTMKTTDRFSTRPSELLPWADPYIARLVTNLQNEVRSQRGQRPRHTSRLEMSEVRFLEAELEPPTTTSTDLDWDWREDTRRPSS